MLDTRTALDSPAPAKQQRSADPLFRREVIENVSTRQHGTILLTHPFSYRVLTVLFVLIAAAIITFFAVFETTRKAQCQGVLRPAAGVIRITPPQTGVITESRVKEGLSVKAGDVMFVLSSERSSANAGSTHGTISTLLTRRRDSFDTEVRQAKIQARDRMAATRDRARILATDFERTEDQIKLQTQRLALSEQSLKRYAELQATNYLSAAQLEEKQGDVIDQRQRLADLRRARSATQRELLNANADLRDLAIQAARESSALERNLVSLEQDLAENEARREILVRAPQDGNIGVINTYLGQSVSAVDTLAILLPANSELEAELYAPSHAVGFVKPGMDVLLRYQAYPYQKFGQHPGRVVDVSNTSLSPQELGVSLPGSASEPLYRIRIKLEKHTVQAYGVQMPLKSGMMVDGSVVLEKRRLYEWALEPLFSISGRL